MNRKQIYYFIATCLTLSINNDNKERVLKILKSKSINWIDCVDISSNHYVLTTLFCSLRKSNLLKFLPSDLVSYLEEMTTINRNRNIQIIKDIHEINNLFLKNKITPIFLKGSANMLAGLYEDLGERMVGDIDLIVSKDEYLKSINLLESNGYHDFGNLAYNRPGHIHYKRLKKDNQIAAIEIHNKFLFHKKYDKEFNFDFIKREIQYFGRYNVLSYKNKINYSIISHQINDYGYCYKNINFRTAYDVLLLSKKTSALDAINSLDKLTNPLNCFLATCFELFQKPLSLKYNMNGSTKKYMKVFKSQLTDLKIAKRRIFWIKFYLKFQDRLEIICRSLHQKEYRKWAIERLKSKISKNVFN